jgi:hypothetical protein
MKSITTTIDINLDVYKTIVNNSNYINEPANDVLKRLLKIDRDLHSSGNNSISSAETGGLIVKEVFLKNGLKLRKHFKGNLFEAYVRDGYIEFNKKRYTSPSGAAVEAAKGSVNGWRFWEYYDDKSDSWKMLETLRS